MEGSDTYNKLREMLEVVIKHVIRVHVSAFEKQLAEGMTGGYINIKDEEGGEELADIDIRIFATVSLAAIKNPYIEDDIIKALDKKYPGRNFRRNTKDKKDSISIIWGDYGEGDDSDSDSSDGESVECVSQ